MQLICRNIVLDVNGTETFQSLEKMLEEKGYDLFDWHINFDSKIDPNSQSPEVLVRFPSGKTIAVRFWNTISQLKREIDVSEGIPPYDQLLFFAGDLLHNDYTLYDSKISAGSTLDAALVFRGSLMVETVPEKTIYLNVYDDFTIREVKDLIERKTGISTDHHRLVNIESGEELVDTDLLGCYLLRDMSTLRLVEDTCVVSRNEMKLSVEIVATGDTIELDVASDDTISSVKDMIQKKRGYPVGQQLLYLPQKLLMDTSTLADYYILKKTTLRLVVIPEYHEGMDQQQLTMNSEGNPPKRQKRSA